MWMTSCPEAMGWGFWDLKKKKVSWDSTLEEGRRFLIWARPDQFGSTGCPRVGWVSELRTDDGQTVSIERLCLSLLMSENLKLKKVKKKVSYLKLKSVSCFRIPIRVYTLWTFYACEYLGRICGRVSCFRIPICVWTLWTFYAFEYLGRIFGRGYAT